MKKYISIMVLIIVLMITLMTPVMAETDYSTVRAKVIESSGTEKVENEDTTQKVQKVDVRILEGDYKTEEYEMEYIISENINEDNVENTELKQNDNLIVKLEETDGEVTSVEFQEVIKTNYYIYMLAAFIVLTLLIGRKKAIKPILILLILVGSVYFVFINNIRADKNMIIVALATELIVLISTAAILNGLSKKMITNIVSSVLSIGISGVLMGLMFRIMKVSMDIIDFKININEVIALGAMIACTELSLTIATIIASELEKQKQENQYIKVKELIKIGLNTGIESFTNVIGIPVIMYACGITTLITLLTENGINNDYIAVTIAYVFSILIGAVLTIPITSVVYTLWNKNKMFYKAKSDNIIEGQRSLKL